MAILTLFVVYRNKQKFAGCMSHNFDSRENYVPQPAKYRVPGFIRNIAGAIQPINDKEEEIGVGVVSTMPYWQYGTTDEYARIRDGLNSKGWVLYTIPGCIWCKKQNEIFPEFAQTCNRDLTECPNGYPAWRNKYTGETKLGMLSIDEIKQLADPPIWDGSWNTQPLYASNVLKSNFTNAPSDCGCN